MRLFLEVADLHKSFGDLKAVDGVSLSIQEGQCLALLGPNGAGKTTTVEILEGLRTPDKGEIHFFGQNLKTHRSEVLERIGVVLQETRLYRKFTVLETLNLFASFYRKSIKAEVLLQSLNLMDKAKSRLEALSGGQKQRLYLACALINDPDLLFLDEPTTGLDPQARRLLWGHLKTILAEGRSLLLTTHYMEEAEQLADVVAIMDKGKIIASGSPRQLIAQHVGGKILRILDDQSRKSALREEFGPSLTIQDARNRDGKLAFELKSSDLGKDLNVLGHFYTNLGQSLPDLEVVSPTLEDVFIKLTGRTIRND